MCLSDSIFLALGPMVSANASASGCMYVWMHKFNSCQDVFFNLLIYCIFPHTLAFFAPLQSGVNKKTVQAKKNSPGKYKAKNNTYKMSP